MPTLTPICFAEAARQYLGWTRQEYDHPNTWRRIAVSFVSLTAHVGCRPVDSVTPADIEAFKAARRSAVKPVTIRHDLHALSGFFRYALKAGWAAANPVREVKIPSDRDAIRIHVLTRDEEQSYFQAAQSHPKLNALARLMLATGLRPSEVLALRRSDVDAEQHRIRIRRGKTAAARREVKLVGEAIGIVESLCAARRSDDYLFPGLKPGSPATKLNGPHNRACKRAGVCFVLYDLRHTFATRAASLGMPLTTLAAILGHNGLRCVMRYVHPGQSVMDEAMERFATA
jgi:integrase